MTLRRTICLLTVILICTTTAPVVAQEPGPQVVVTQSWQGYTRVPGWVEVEFLVDNKQSDWNGAITIMDMANKITYQSIVDSPQYSRKAFRLALLSSNGADLSFNLEGPDGQSPDKNLPITALSSERVCAYMGNSNLPLPGKLANCGTFLNLKSLTDLPETPMVWDSVDVLIINGLSTAELTSGQSAAMLAWVAAGGHLVISGGLTLGLTLEHLPAVLKIGEPGPVAIYNSIPELTPGQISISVSQLKLTPQSTTLLENAGAALAARQPVGKGFVDILGWDVTHATNTNWLENCWAVDPFPATAIRVYGEVTTSAHIGPNVFDLQEIPSDHSPEPWLWLIVFIIYILLIGPTTVIMIRRLKKPILAWGLLPGWIILALIVMSILLRTTYGMTFPLIHDIAFISMNGANMPARVIQGTALLAPQSKGVSWSVPAYIRPLWGQFAMDDTWSYEGVPYPLTVSRKTGQIQLYTGKPIGMLTWGVEGIISGGEFESYLEISSIDKKPTITGSLYSAYTLENVFLMWSDNDDQIIQLSDYITAFATIPISMTLAAKPQVSEFTDTLCRHTLHTYSTAVIKPVTAADTQQPDLAPECNIIGKTDSVPFPTSDIAGAYIGESCVIYTIPCPSQMAGTFTTQLKVAINEDDYGWIDTDNDRIALYPGSSSYIFGLPTYININQVSAVFISISAANEKESQLLLEDNKIILSLWDWQNSEWVAQSLGTANAEGEYKIALMDGEAQRYFDLHNKNLQLQFITPDNVYLQLFLPVRIEGIW